ncbi:hypothetical protein [Promicromonospora sp. MEB111]|uniref:hypothetical protein n=1 Tax=Promicromonospora sp. MEB111 TaxID=3040301 RepID=UPI002551AE87|nr:hypothetical protein [Promicromonospora sp. MEB111]
MSTPNGRNTKHENKYHHNTKHPDKEHGSKNRSVDRAPHGLSYQACAVIVAVAGMCAWVAHDVLGGAVRTTPVAAPAAATSPAQAGDVYVTTPQAAAPPVVLMVAPDGSGATEVPGTTAGAHPSAAGGTAAPGTADGASAPVAAASAASVPGTGAAVQAVPGATPTTPGQAAAAGGPAARVVVVPTGRQPGSAALPEGRQDQQGQAGRQAPQDRRVSYQVLAADGSIVYVGADGQLVANTGAVSSSGVLALGSDGSGLRSGASSVTAPPTAAAPASSPASSAAQGGTTASTHQNDSFGGMLLGYGQGSSMAISGFEDHSVSVVGSGQIVTYDDSNVFLGRDGRINANTGDTDSSGLNAVDVTGSVVRSGNSGDAEDTEDEEEGEEEDSEDEDGEDEEDEEPQDGADEQGAGEQGPAASPAGPAAPATTGPTTTGQATVTDEGESSATGNGALVIGADGFDDVSIRSRGDRNVVTYDDSNVVIGGTGPVNTQIGDSDTGGAVVMGVHGSDVRAGCEGDLCYSD